MTLQHRCAGATTPARVVVVGARGFVGGDLVRHLEAERLPVVALGASDIDLCAPESVGLLQGRLRPHDALVFVAALTPDRGRDVATLMRNLAMTQHLGAALAKAPVAHVLYVSSDAVYDDQADRVSEATCTAPGSLHGTMHITRERMLRHDLVGPGIPLCVLRPSLLYGARDTHNGYGPNRFLRTARADGVIALFGGGEERRDHVSVRDLSRVIVLALRHRSEGVLNVATGHSRSFREVAEAVARLCAREVEIQPRPRGGAVTHRSFDTAAHVAAFPEFRYTPLEDGLAATWRDLERGVAG